MKPRTVIGLHLPKVLLEKTTGSTPLVSQYTSSPYKLAEEALQVFPMHSSIQTEKQDSLIVLQRSRIVDNVGNTMNILNRPNRLLTGQGSNVQTVGFEETKTSIENGEITSKEYGDEDMRASGKELKTASSLDPGAKLRQRSADLASRPIAKNSTKRQALTTSGRDHKEIEEFNIAKQLETDDDQPDLIELMQTE